MPGNLRNTVASVAMELIPACSSKPEKPTKVRNPRQVHPTTTTTTIPEKEERQMDRRQLCEEMIQAGHVQSFVDFFYLTHRPDPVALAQTRQQMSGDDEPEAMVKDIELGSREMELLRENLTAAEAARRKGETATVYRSLANLAQYFQNESADPKTGVYFYDKCLEIARITGDYRGEMNANHNLGLAHAFVGDVDAATEFHERHLKMAQELDDDSEIRGALAELIHVYRTAAENRLEQDDPTGAAALFERCLAAAKTAGDSPNEARAGLALGKALIKRGRPKDAIQTLECAEILCKQLDDTDGQGQVCAALADAWQLMGDHDHAADFLERFLELAVDAENLPAEALACSTLGDLLTRRRKDLPRAVDLLRRNFAIAKHLLALGQLRSTKDLDDARILLGIALGYSFLSPYLDAVNNPDLSTLLAWKISRDPLPTPSPFTSDEEPTTADDS